MTEKNIKVSIIMPSLNVREYIEECMDSVINQTLKEIEIICVDAGSDDGTLEILEKYANQDNRIKLFHSDKRSYGYQVNLGINNSNGEYIGIVETDDYIDEKMYETLYNLTNNSTVDIVKSNFYYFHDTNPPKFKADHLKNNLPVNKEFTVYQNPDILLGHPSIWAAIYKRSFLNSNEIRFMEVPGGGWVDNPFLHETALAAQSIVYTDKTFYFYRELNPNSSSNNLSNPNLPLDRSMDILDVLENYKTNETIISHVYIRIFGYIRDLMNVDLVDKKHESFMYFKKVIGRFNGDIVQRNMSITNKLIYSTFSSENFNENSISTKLLVIFVRFIAKVVKYQKQRQYEE